MEQVALSSDQRRPVMVIDNVTTQTVEEEQPPQATLLPRRRPTRPSRNLNFHLHYRDSDGNLVRYDSDIEDALLEVTGSGRQQTLLIPDGQSGYYYFDLEAMEERLVTHLIDGQPVFSSKEPRQIIAEVPWDATAMVPLAAKADKCLRRKILVMVVERFKSNEHLDAILPKKASPRTIVSKSTSTCSATLYEKFVDSVEILLQRFPGDLVGDVIRAAETKETRGGPLQIAFKPVKKSARNVSSRVIRAAQTKENRGGPLQIAFKPVKKSARNVSSRESGIEAHKTKSAFWMSMAAPVAAAHAVYGCAVQLKVLAYLVLLPVSAWKHSAETLSNECSGYVEVDRPEHGLHLAGVTVR